MTLISLWSMYILFKMGLSDDINNSENEYEEGDDDFDPIDDIIDYLVRCAKISFKNAHINEADVRTYEKINIARCIYRKSVSDFLAQYGKYLTANHLQYFEGLLPLPDESENEKLQKSLEELKAYHSDKSKRKRVRNRRYKALQKLRDESDYFSEREMMFRNPLMYEQLIGQFLTDEEIRVRDDVDSENLTFVNMILETVDRNRMRQTKNEQLLSESMEVGCSLTEEKTIEETKPEPKKSVEKVTHWGSFETNPSKPQWGDFKTADATPTFKPEQRVQTMISAPERQLLREEFVQEMYSSFVEGRDLEFDYSAVDEDEQLDDLQQMARDAEEKYFDSEPMECENLEESMRLSQEYGRHSPAPCVRDDLDDFMERLNKRQIQL